MNLKTEGLKYWNWKLNNGYSNQFQLGHTEHTLGYSRIYVASKPRVNSVYKRVFTSSQAVDFVFSFVRRIFAANDLYPPIKGAPEVKVVYGEPKYNSELTVH